MTSSSLEVPGVDFDDLLSDEAVNHPSRFYGALRERCPVYFNPRWNGWIVTSYEHVTAGFRAHEQLSSDRMAGPWGDDYLALPQQSLQEYTHEILSKAFVWRDPPFHSRVRTLLNKAFIPRSIEMLRPRARRLVAELVEALPVGEPVDFLGGFAFHLPVMVICEYLGIPGAARDSIKQWSDDLSAVIFVRGHDPDRNRRAEEAARAMFDYMRSVVRERRRSPQDDLISVILAAQDESHEGLTEDEIVANILLLVFAGHETTMNLISNGIAAFWRHPDQWRRLQEQPALVRHAVEEVLRVDGPLRATARWARSPIALGGTEIKANDRVLLVQIAANHDPAAFEDPERFDIGRTGNRHVAFGAGIHTCLGAPLARMETHEAFSYLSERFDRIEVIEDPPVYTPAIASGGFEELHVIFRER